MVAVAGAPQSGATVSALALALGWPGSSVLVDADVDVSPVRSGLLQSQFGGTVGLMHLGTAQRQGNLGLALESQLVNIAQGDAARLVLLGLTDPDQAGSMEYAWEPLAAALAVIAADPRQPDVVVDLGRSGLLGRHGDLARRADVLLYTVRGTLAGVAAASPRLARIHEDLVGPGVAPEVRLLTVQGQGANRYPDTEVSKALRIASLGELPADPALADWLSHGGPQPRGARRAALMRQATAVAQHLRAVRAERASRIALPMTGGVVQEVTRG